MGGPQHQVCSSLENLSNTSVNRPSYGRQLPPKRNAARECGAVNNSHGEKRVKFCYIDESGTGNEPFGVMAGIIVDAKRMRVTKAEWQELLDILSGILGKEIMEIHTRDFYPGNSPWRGLAGDVRARLITVIFDWLRLRKHKIVFTAVQRAKFDNEFSATEFAADIGSL